MQRVDYDRIAPKYDEPLRAHALDPNLLRFLDERPGFAANRARLLDVGCGTGTQLAANRAGFPAATMVGLDPFLGMLRIARERCRSVAWVRGDGSRMPFKSDRFDYVTNQFSYHHIRDKAAFVHEVARVLDRRGRFVLTNIDPWEMPGWVLYRFFPAAWDVDRADFLPTGALVALMREADFTSVRVERRHRRTQEPLSAYLAHARGRHRASQFLSISDAEYDAGVRRIERALADAPSSDTTVESEFCLLTIIGDRPER